ncbi:MAG: sensor histidine kinase, partial [Candidatus Kapaibacteriota bacterium]
KEFKIVKDELYTEFAPAERDPQDAITRLYNIINEQTLLKEVINAVPEIFLILNSKRQIVFGNTRLTEFFKQKDLNPFLGKRPGEILTCIHSDENPAGCGTSLFCAECGAVRAILESYNGKESTYECRILSKNNKAYEFRVYASPYKIGSEEFTFFSIQDISHEKRRQVLERVFYHDLMNTVGNLHSIASILKHSPEAIYEFNEILQEIVEELIGQIKFQKLLLAAENGSLSVEISKVQSLDILYSLKAEYLRNKIAEGKEIVISKESENITFETDSNLIRRIIGNLLKNALEAIDKGKSVVLKCTGTDEDITFSVHNDTVIPPEVQLQLFQRSFSTKGAGRGIGTYSVKLFTENYLKGKVWFISNEKEGTTFFVHFSRKFKTQ